MLIYIAGNEGASRGMVAGVPIAEPRANGNGGDGGRHCAGGCHVCLVEEGVLDDVNRRKRPRGVDVEGVFETEEKKLFRRDLSWADGTLDGCVYDEDLEERKVEVWSGCYR